MAENTGIEWADHTFNPWVGCSKVSPACDHCYAESWAKRTGAGEWGGPRRRTSTANWQLPLKWNRLSAQWVANGGRRTRVFCASLADVFDNQVPDDWRKELFELIRLTPSLDWLLLTKRPQNIIRMVRSHGSVAGNGTRYLPDNVQLGTTIEDQKRADLNLPALLKCRPELGARVLFVSVEPMLGPIELSQACAGYMQDFAAMGSAYLQWVICGGESGSGARPMHPDWARGLRDQCAAAGVPFLFKQWGEWCPRGPESMGYPSVDGVPRLRITDAGQDGQDLGSKGGNDVWMNRAGKKAAGRLLDGVEHNGFPT